LPEAIDERESRRFKALKITGDLPHVRPISRIYIHCGPCACAIQTALNLTQGDGVSEYFDFAIRIDERLPTSCRRSSTALDVLAAIHDAIDGHVVNSWDAKSKSIGFIDCPDLEKRIFTLEQERFEHSESASVLQKILAEEYEGLKSDLPIEAIIFIAEADLSHHSLESPPFSAEARKPRGTDIYAFVRSWTEAGRFWQRKYLGSYTRSKKAIEKKRARLSLLTNPTPPLTSSIIPTAPPIPRNKGPRSKYTAESDS
jgi:hypothetical protein